ncbi:MAG: NADH-quinone oxidoreductase subunit J [Fimbriimonadia bacterium]
MTGEIVLFVCLAALLAVSGLAVIVARRAIYSALALVVNFFGIAILYFTLGSQFLGIAQVVVYLGAIMVLFLFCIMLLQMSAEEALEEKAGLHIGAAIVLCVAFLGILWAQVLRVPTQTGTLAADAQREALSTVEAIGSGLFTRWALPFEITSVLLLVGIVGSILLAKRRL